MTTLTVTLTAICAGGDHLAFTISGAKSLVIPMNASEFLNPITDEELAVYVRVIAQLCKVGKTVTQTKTALQAGITVTA